MDYFISKIHKVEPGVSFSKISESPISACTFFFSDIIRPVFHNTIFESETDKIWKVLERDLTILESEYWFTSRFHILVDKLISKGFVLHDLWTPWTEWLLEKPLQPPMYPNGFVLKCTTENVPEEISKIFESLGFVINKNIMSKTNQVVYGQSNGTVPTDSISYPWPFNPSHTITHLFYGSRQSSKNFTGVGYSILCKNGNNESKIKTLSKHHMTVKLGPVNFNKTTYEGSGNIINGSKLGNAEMYMLIKEKVEKTSLWKHVVWMSIFDLPDNVNISSENKGNCILIKEINNGPLAVTVILKNELSFVNRILNTPCVWKKENILYKKKITVKLESDDISVPEFNPKLSSTVKRSGLLYETGNPYIINCDTIL
ncbi:I6-like protein [Salmon gill poxvirus]|uniref:I6-like protein n=1 Tax=Salmon gill poxvirus TaxID=1680908 RepID=A0A0H4XWL3_9POXV|nr:I6-like protein [Salmon gill poxvirus]AKR04206.1 I6-like protein [Salmon gill poxvirus]